MGLFNNFTDTIIYKQSSDLQDRFSVLQKLSAYYPDDSALMDEMYAVGKGLRGENEIEYQLKKANIGMYVLRDIRLVYEDLTAQIDCVIITPVHTYLVECKNLFGSITINENGDFIREYRVGGRTVKKGIYSPVRQAQEHKEVLMKIIAARSGKIMGALGKNSRDRYYRTLVVVTDPESMLKTRYAPRDVSSKVIRADNLVRYLADEVKNRTSGDLFENRNEMEKTAKFFLSLDRPLDTNYFLYYREKFSLVIRPTVIDSNRPPATEEEQIRPNNSVLTDDEQRRRLKALRTDISNRNNIPAYYVFSNQEMETLIKLRPKSLEDLRTILPEVKVRLHGEKILKEIKNRGD